MRVKKSTALAWASIKLILLLLVAAPLSANSLDMSNQVIFGLKISAGGRFDNVRMCVGSDRGVRGGPAVDVSFFTEIGIARSLSLIIDIPVFRPIFFATAFDMLQFEPEVGLNYWHDGGDTVDFVTGAGLGIIFHYGPDFNSDTKNRGPDFFAMGPKLTGYLGLDFKRPGSTFNFQLGAKPYFAPLFSIDDPANHNGFVAGGMLEGYFRFRTQD